MAAVLVIQPGFPAEIPYFVRGLKRMGATVLGVGDQPKGSLPPVAKEGLDAYLQVSDFWNAEHLVKSLRQWKVPVKVEQVICLWEAGMELAAEVRQAFRLPGLTPQQTQLFRNKDLMRQVLNRHGIRNPRHATATNMDEIRTAAEHTGFPLIVKPVAGAGSANTYRIDTKQQLEDLAPRLRGIREAIVEEFVEGTEFTFDTITINGRIAFRNVELYRPDMLSARSVEHISPQTISLRDLNAPHFQKAYKMGQDVISALGYKNGFTHMEWFLKPDGDVVFGEIAARPPGGNSGELMNYTCDCDIYNAWAEAMLHGRISQHIERRYNVAMIFKRARGQGRIKSVHGLETLQAKLGPSLLRHELLPIGARRRNWKQTLLSDGFLLLRHADLGTTLGMADLVAEKLVITAE
jgi:hypothetical protein